MLALTLATALVPAAACEPPSASTPPEPIPTEPPAQIAGPRLTPGARVPAPSGPVLLTVAGQISQTNGTRGEASGGVGSVDDGSGGADVLQLDQGLLDQLAQVRVVVYDPWVRRDLTFQGAWLQDVLALAQPTGSARSLHITALDNYQVDLAVAEVEAGGILLATKNGDGSPIPVEDGGPTRIVFVGGVASGASADQWIWSIAKIDVR